jgi:D-serine deaminase-like pyridoxal phosphate-dependent protein
MRDPQPPVERAVALDPRRDARVDVTTKGFPAVDPPIPLAAVSEQGWTLTDLLPPTLVLREKALAHNIDLMADYCATHGVGLAPHGKTTMAPQLWRRQLDAGAWGISAATVAQARVMLAAGVRRVLIANEVTDGPAVRWMASRMHDADIEIVCSVDSGRAVGLLADGLGSSPRPLPVLVELGHAGGRTGCRTLEDALEVAHLVTSEPHLSLAGATGFEGTICGDRSPACLEEVASFLGDLAALIGRLRNDDLIETEETLVSAGGSTFFDLVVEHLHTTSSGGAADRVLLRSGRYVTHDSGENERVSPFAHDLGFLPAIEAWGAVLSRPEPTLAILNLGRRDAPFDQDLPIPFSLRRRSGVAVEIAGTVVVEKLNDQHAFCRVSPEISIEPGDLVGCGVSHPCTAFDKWRVIPVLDDHDRVVDAVATYF